MNTGIRRVVCIAMIVAFAVTGAHLFAGGQAQQPQPAAAAEGAAITTLRVGALFPQTGGMAFGGSNSLQGTQIAVELFNETNPYGITVELVTADAPDPATGTTGVRQLITQQNVDVVMGTFSSAVASATAPAAERLNVLYVETTAWAEGITRNSTNVLRTTISSGSLGAAAADFILTGLARELGVAEADMRVALVFTDDEFGTSIADAAVRRIQSSPARLVVRESYPAATTSDLSSVLLRIQQERAHAVIHIAQVPDGVLFWRQAQQLGVDMPAVVGVGGGYGQVDFARPLGDNADGIFNVVPSTSGSINVDSLTPSAQNLLKELQTRVAQRGWTQGPYTDWGFMGTWIFLNEVVPNAASTSIADMMAAAANVRVDALDSITGFGFEFAGVNHENSGQNLRAIPVVQQWQGGQLRVTYPRDLAVADFINVPLPPWSQRTQAIGQ
ncbi:MAG: ABC transporter substrate-binding protein [Spirochaetaceae bacterium]|nr:MAG: ABC transporter substrate-binding protein [Spirochaetaceae bacterium]